MTPRAMLFAYIGKPAGWHAVQCNLCGCSMIRIAAVHHAKDHVARGEAEYVGALTTHVEDRFATTALPERETPQQYRQRRADYDAVRAEVLARLRLTETRQ